MDILTLTLIILMTSSIILSWYIGITCMKIKKNRFIMDYNNSLDDKRLKERNFNINTKIDENIESELDRFVTDCINEYILINYAHTNNYLNADECDKIFREVVDMIKKRLTPALFDKMTLYYNKEEIGNVIVYKAYLNIMKFIMERNNNVKF